MKRVLITGVGGAIGAHMLAHIMHNTDWFVVGTDSWKSEDKGYFDRITEVCKDHSDWSKRIEIITHDLTAPFTDREVEKIGHIDYVINLAARSDVSASIADPLPFVRNNLEIAFNMADYARRAKPEKFIHFSTDEVYGPVTKDSDGHKEWAPMVPSNAYSASKVMQEAWFVEEWRSNDLRLIITNTMNNFGEMQAPSKFPAMIQQKIEKGELIKIHAKKDGEIGTRYYLHSRNTADAIVFILKNVEPIIHERGGVDLPERLHIVGDKQVSNLDLVKTIGELMGKEPKYELEYFHEDNPGHDLHYGLNGDKLKALGWTSPIPFEESLKTTIEWQQRNPIWNK